MIEELDATQQRMNRAAETLLAIPEVREAILAYSAENRRRRAEQGAGRACSPTSLAGTEAVRHGALADDRPEAG